MFESADALVLGEETATGSFPAESVSTMASILKNAEDATHYYALHSFSRDFSAKPFSSSDAPAYCLARMANDASISGVVTFTSSGDLAQTVSRCALSILCCMCSDMTPEPKFDSQALCRYRPPVPHIVATTNKALAQQCNLYFGMFSVLLPNAKLSVAEALKAVLESAKERGCYISGDVGVLHGAGNLFADQDGVLSIIKV